MSRTAGAQNKFDNMPSVWERLMQVLVPVHAAYHKAGTRRPPTPMTPEQRKRRAEYDKARWAKRSKAHPERSTPDVFDRFIDSITR